MITINTNGVICSEIEVRQSQKGEYATFSLASRKDTKNAEGNYDSDFFRVTVFGHNVNYLKQNGQKGLKAMVSGKFSSRTYTRQDGGFGYALEIVADRVELLTYPQRNVETRPAYTTGYAQTTVGQVMAQAPVQTAVYKNPQIVYAKDIAPDDICVDINGNPIELPF